TDQFAHHPDARYWIPTLDEWIKGGFYDPNYGGTGIGGWWWNTPAATNEPLIHGPPGIGQANSAFSLPDDGHYRIPLGAYPTVQSPWGLLDMAGATAEWSGTVDAPSSIPLRLVMGSHWTRSDVGIDSIPRIGHDYPSLPSLFNGLRVASAVPAPGAWLVAVAAGAWCLRRRR
ncbi:MAG: hypothetical protein JNK25_00405, partial [Phycisphaerae bacterium]|nr:hypothetical protein [Phycisphaerae bacterium]